MYSLLQAIFCRRRLLLPMPAVTAFPRVASCQLPTSPFDHCLLLLVFPFPKKTTTKIPLFAVQIIVSLSVVLYLMSIFLEQLKRAKLNRQRANELGESAPLRLVRKLPPKPQETSSSYHCKSSREPFTEL